MGGERDATRERDAALGLLGELTAAVGGAPDAQAALREVLRRICDRTGWLVGEAWVMDPATDRLGLAVSVLGGKASASGLSAFVDAALAMSFPAGVGLPGEVYEARRRIWVDDLVADRHFVRHAEARSGGLGAALGMPVLAHGEPTAVLAFFMEEIRPEDRWLADLVAAVAAQIGLFLERKRAEDRAAELAREVLAHSTPVLHVLEGIVLAPVAGVLDDARCDQLSRTLLDATTRESARVALIDITGVPSVDAPTARRLLELTRALGLVGARVILTGIRPATAMALVGLGVDLGAIASHATLSDGLRAAMRANEPARRGASR